MSKKVLIAVYGTPEDRLRSLALAESLRLSQSAVLLRLLREKYKEIHGDADPTKLVGNKH